MHKEMLTNGLSLWPNLANGLAKFLWLNNCPICQGPNSALGEPCSICHKIIIKQRLNLDQCCVCCAQPLPNPHRSNAFMLYCGQCQHRTPHFDRCLAAVQYSPSTAKLINNLKHHGKLSNLHTIERELLYMLKKHPVNKVDLLVPVPLHPTRLSERGFNQSIEITKRLSKALQIPLARHLCQRISKGKPQQTLNRKARTSNLKKAFQFTSRIDGMRIAIIDDVVTTTATIDSVAKQALIAGALSVEAWCFSRTP